jgi:hypothetical protein
MIQKTPHHKAALPLIALLISYPSHAQEAPSKDATEAAGISFILPSEASETETSIKDTESTPLKLPDTDSSSDTTTVDGEEIYVLDDFVVTTADDKGYYSANSISATRTNALVKTHPSRSPSSTSK